MSADKERVCQQCFSKFYGPRLRHLRTCPVSLYSRKIQLETSQYAYARGSSACTTVSLVFCFKSLVAYRQQQDCSFLTKDFLADAIDSGVCAYETSSARRAQHEVEHEQLEDILVCDEWKQRLQLKEAKVGAMVYKGRVKSKAFVSCLERTWKCAEEAGAACVLLTCQAQTVAVLVSDSAGSGSPREKSRSSGGSKDERKKAGKAPRHVVFFDPHSESGIERCSDAAAGTFALIFEDMNLLNNYLIYRRFPISEDLFFDESLCVYNAYTITLVADTTLELPLLDPVAMTPESAPTSAAAPTAAPAVDATTMPATDTSESTIVALMHQIEELLQENAHLKQENLRLQSQLSAGNRSQP